MHYFPYPLDVSKTNTKKKKKQKTIYKNLSQIKNDIITMNPTTITSKPVVIVASEVTERPLKPTNQCSIM
ncbi:hypothetical protein RclHR1_05710010 [Rhizophagus clarus]|uniref:Uncharacterized protein n=1 Tax=Rhizophagus clarus TaxID=94130 RepID=A0A2Z6SG57_9GLOM|nr:hypothetical protein RclHR1_05710010 [Rhizophagus clarus]